MSAWLLSNASRNVAMKLSLLIGGILLVGWSIEVTMQALEVPAYLLPTPSAVVAAFVEGWPRILDYASRTVAAAFVGLAISVTLSSILAALFVQNKAVFRASFPFLIALRTAPVVAIAPLITLLIGRGFQTSVVVVIIITFFPIIVNLMRGLSSPEETALELLHVCGASRGQELWYVRVPYSLPFLFAGLRIASAGAILGAMLAEWITGSRGLGYLILESADLREVPTMWAATGVSIGIALGVFWLMSAGERYLTSWRNT